MPDTVDPRTTCARELEDHHWPNVADDVRDGLSVDQLLKRLREIGEEDSIAAQIIATYDF